MNWYRIYRTAQDKVKFSDLEIGEQFYHSYYGMAEKTGPDTYRTETKPELKIRNPDDFVGAIYDLSQGS